MPDLHVSEPHALSVDELRRRLAGFTDVLAKYGARLEWEGAVGRVRGVPGVGGHVTLAPGRVDVHVSIAWFVARMGLDPRKLEATVRRRLRAVLEAPAEPVAARA